MPETSLGITYPDNMGHTRLWEHFGTMAGDVDGLLLTRLPYFTTFSTSKVAAGTTLHTVTVPNMGAGVVCFIVCFGGAGFDSANRDLTFDLGSPVTNHGAAAVRALSGAWATVLRTGDYTFADDTTDLVFNVNANGGPAYWRATLFAMPARGGAT